MHKYKNLSVIGTSHIAKQSINQVAELIEEIKPDIIALELDQKRFNALFQKHKPSIRHIASMGIKAFLLNLIGAYVEKKLGKMVGTKPGDEMRQAVILARKHSIKIALIDQDIDITLRKLISRLTWKEKFQFMKDFFSQLVLRKKQKIKFDLAKVPSQKIISSLVKEVKAKYPSVYKTLIFERNKLMAKGLYKLISLYPDKKILAIIGAGHEKEIIGDVKSKK